MDKRKTQRILGILVIIALIIILFPLIFSKNEMATETVSVNAPAFPDQQNTPTFKTAENETTANPEAPLTTPIAEALPVDNNTSNNVQSTTSSNTESTINNTTSDSKTSQSMDSPIGDSPVPNNSSMDDTKHTPLEVEADQPKSSSTEPVPSNVEPVVSPTEDMTSSQPPTKKPALKTSKHSPKPARHDIAKLNKQAWIVQMGSFKNKENARHLTDKLRAAGFNAFTKEIVSAKGNVSTRVYVGPEFKEAVATKISQKIQQQMNLPSIVLPYKPLAL